MSWLADWWFAPAPRERLATLRILVGLYAFVWVAVRIGELATLSRLPPSHFHAVGIVFDQMSPDATIAVAIGTLALLAAFTLGLWYRYTAPLAALALLWVLSYRNAFGQVFHTENLVVLHVLALACAPAADAYALSRARHPNPCGHGWALKLCIALTAATYLLAGVAKLRIAGFAWVDGDTLRNQIAVDNLRKALLGSWTAPLATPLLDHPAAFVAVSWLTLAIELGAPVALLGGRIATLWAVGAWSFHVGVVLLMNIWFPYPLFGFAYLALMPLERAYPWLRRRFSR